MAEDGCFLLVDPDWEPSADETVPDDGAVVGRWPIASGGEVAAFRANPDYRPRAEDGATDALDALFRMAVAGDAVAEHIQLVLRDATLHVALGAAGRPVVAPSPDDVPCVVVATSDRHREQIEAAGWQQADLLELVTLLPDQIDVLFNPSAPVSFRLVGDFVRDTVLLSDDEIAEAQQAVRACLPARDQSLSPPIAGTGMSH